MAARNTADVAKQPTRSPHPDFKQVEASRPPWDASATFRYTQTVQPDWQFGGGANGSDAAAAATAAHVAIDPHAPARSPAANYKLLISAVVPRPIALVSTRSADGAEANLAPFSYFQLVGHDPPLFVLGISAAGAKAKDSLRLLRQTGECVVNLVSEALIEAANAAAVDAPPAVSEWVVAGLTPVHDCLTVRAPRVREAVFSVECRLESARDFAGRADPARVATTLVVLEGTRFWAREDALGEERDRLDPKVREK